MKVWGMLQCCHIVFAKKSLTKNLPLCWSIVVKEKPTVGSPFFGEFPSTRIPKATKDINVRLFPSRSNSCKSKPANSCKLHQLFLVSYTDDQYRQLVFLSLRLLIKETDRKHVHRWDYTQSERKMYGQTNRRWTYITISKNVLWKYDFWSTYCRVHSPSLGMTYTFRSSCTYWNQTKCNVRIYTFSYNRFKVLPEQSTLKDDTKSDISSSSTHFLVPHVTLNVFMFH